MNVVICCHCTSELSLFVVLNSDHHHVNFIASALSSFNMMFFLNLHSFPLSATMLTPNSSEYLKSLKFWLLSFLNQERHCSLISHSEYDKHQSCLTYKKQSFIHLNWFKTSLLHVLISHVREIALSWAKITLNTMNYTSII